MYAVVLQVTCTKTNCKVVPYVVKKKERRKKGKEEGRGMEECESTMNKYSDITQHTHSSSC